MEDELFDYGTFKLRKDALISNINNNIDSYMAYNRYSGEDAENFKAAMKYILSGIERGTITKNLEHISENVHDASFRDKEGKLTNDNEWHGRALDLLHIIATKQGLLAENRKATLGKKEEPKEYDTLDSHFLKAYFPTAKNIADPNIDWDNFKKAYKGKEADVYTGMLNSYIKGNISPESKAAALKALEGLKNGVDSEDYLAMNQLGGSRFLYAQLAKDLKDGDPKGGNKTGIVTGIKNTGQGLDNTKLNEEIITEVTYNDLKNMVKNAAEALNDGDYYIKNQGKHRELWVLVNNQFHKLPLSFIDNKEIGNIRNILQRGYRNLYTTNNLEQTLKDFLDYVNEYMIEADDIKNSFPIKGKAMGLYKLLGELGLPNDVIIEYLKRATKTLDGKYSLNPYFELVIMPLSMGTIPYRQEGGVLKADGGAALLYNATNPLYKTLYKEGAQSLGLKGSSNSLRSPNLKPSPLHENELVLNDYYKQFKLYENPEDRHKDFISWANQNYEEGDNIISLLNRYNKGIDDMYNYKQSDDARTYKDANGNVFLSLLTGEFNNIYNQYYSGANSRVFGFDPNSASIAGSATMGRHPDISDEDIEMDFSKHEIANENLKKLLTESKLTKTKTGHYINNVTPLTNSAEDGTDEGKNSGDGNLAVTTENDNNGSLARTAGGNKTKLPEVETPIEVPTPTSTMSKNLPFALKNFLASRRANRAIRDLNNARETYITDPIFMHDSVYGNLRAIAESNRRGAQRTALTKLLFTSDNAQNMAMLYDTFNKNTEDFILALGVDDATRREREAKAKETADKVYLYNHENALKNKERIYQLKNEKNIGEQTFVNAEYQGEKNFTDELKTYRNADIAKLEEIARYKASTELWDQIQRTPNTFIDKWSIDDLKLWDRHMNGEVITDPSEKQRILSIQTLMLDAYLLRMFPGSTPFRKPSMDNIRLGGPFNPTGLVAAMGRKGGLLKYMRKGGITKDMSKAIIEYLKESNKNYNKSIDRAAKGLYNSIKLQRNKK